MSEETNDSDSAQTGFPWLLILLLLLAAGGVIFWLFPRPTGLDRSQEVPQPEITSQASSLPAETHAELAAELQLRMYALDQVDEQLIASKSQPLAGAVTPERSKEMVAQLARLEALVNSPEVGGLELRQARLELRELWKERFRSLQEFLAEPGGTTGLPEIPKLDMSLLASLGGDAQARVYQRRYQELSQHLQRLRMSRKEAFDADLAGRSQRLSRVVQLRYVALSRLSKMGALILFDDPNQWISDVSLELQTYPLRKRGLFLLTLARMQQRTGGGSAWALGLIIQLGQVLLAFGLVLLPLAAVRVRSARQAPSWRGAAAWGWVWILSLVALTMVSGTVADAARPLISLVGIYALVRAYGQVSEGPLLSAISTSYIGQTVGVRTHARRDLRRIGTFLLVQGWVNALTLAVAGPGSLLVFVETIFSLLFKLIYLMLAWSWRMELGITLGRLVPAPLGPLLEKLCKAPLLSWLLAPLAVPLVMLMSLLHALVRRSLQFEWGKRLTAGVLRHWMERAAESDAVPLHPVPSSYAQKFLELNYPQVPAWDLSDPAFRARLDNTISTWLAGQGAESRLALHGPNGSREKVREYLTETYAEKVEVIHLHLEQRLQRVEDLRQLLATHLDMEDEEAPPRLVIVPEAQRLFLATLGGFAVLRELSRVMSRHRKRIFWCLILPTQTLRYLKIVTLDDNVFPLALQLPRWKVAAIQSMVEARHQHTGLESRFSVAVQRAAEATPGATPAGHYYRVLADLCQGNPAVARDLFLASVRMDDQGVVVIGLPQRNPMRQLTALPKIAVYLLTAILRHGDLTFSEAVAATGLAEARLYMAWERCLELGVLIQHADGRATVARLWRADIAYFLRERNLLDGD